MRVFCHILETYLWLYRRLANVRLIVVKRPVLDNPNEKASSFGFSIKKTYNVALVLL